MRNIAKALSLSGLVLATPVLAEGPVVVELYTSQGCSACPPADALLHELAERPDIIALSLHVDYWDYIGWKDSFADPSHAQRQHGYARAANGTTVYTPQMIINGVDHVVGSRPMEVADALRNHWDKAPDVDVTLTRADDVLIIDATAQTAGDYIVQMIRYSEDETVDIRRGENAGRVINYTNVVTSLDEIGTWDGQAALNMSVQIEGDAPSVVLIQHSGNGPIAGAAELE